MIKSIIKYSKLEDRIDAEYYKPEYFNISEKLNTIGYRKLGEYLKDINRNPMAYGFTYVENGTPLLRGVDINPPFINLKNTKYISKFTHNNFSSTTIFPGDLIMTVRGSIGQVGVVLNEFNEANISPNLIYLRPFNKNVSCYLPILLNSKIGQSQINRMITGSVQGTITEPEIASIKVPNLPKSIVEKVISYTEQCHQKRISSEQKYAEAQKLINDYLQIDNNFNLKKTFTIPFSQLESRLDGEFYQPKYQELFALLDNIKTVSIKDIANYNFRGVQPEYLDKSDYKALTSQYILDKNVDYDNLPSITKKTYFKNSDYQLNYGDVVTYTTGAYVGRTQTWIDKNIKAIASNHVNVLRVTNFNPIYIGFVINSFVGQMQTQRLVTGAAQAELYPSDIEKLIIPIVSIEIQNKISNLYLEHHKLQNESKQLLERAKLEVEELIENGTKI